jgi:hypothetical protein
MMAGDFALERTIKLYDLADINMTVRESADDGTVIKPVLRMPY